MRPLILQSLLRAGPRGRSGRDGPSARTLPVGVCGPRRSFASSSILRENRDARPNVSQMAAGLTELRARGLVADVSSRAVDAHMADAARAVYVGVDPTAPSLHVGHLIPILCLAQLARAGHRGIVVVGGATGSIGDPSGRSTERNQLDPAALQRNAAALRRQIVQLLTQIQARSDALFGPNPLAIDVVDNAEWTGDVTLLDFLRDVGKYTRMSDMLARESVASRLNRTSSGGQPSGMSFTEFAYQLLQAYDFHHLHATRGCTIQLGGSDQMGNIMAGIELILRKRSASASASAFQGAVSELSSPTRQAPTGAPTEAAPSDDPAYGITLPLLLTSSGQKIGKSAGNALWLTPSLLPHVDFYQYFYRLGDVDAGKALRALTLLPESHIRQVEEDNLSHGKAKASERGLQRLLASEVTRLVRGDQAVQDALLAERLLSGDAWRTAPVDEIRSVLGPAKDAALVSSEPATTRRASKFVEVDNMTFSSWTLIHLVVEMGLAKSKSEARTLVKNGGVYLNGERQADAQRQLTISDAVGVARAVHLRIGKTDPRIILIRS